MEKHQSKNDENLSNVNKTKHQKKGDRKVQDGRLKFKQKINTNEGRSQKEQKKINYSNLPKL